MAYGLAILLAAAAADTDTVLEPRALGEFTLLPPLELDLRVSVSFGQVGFVGGDAFRGRNGG